MQLVPLRRGLFNAVGNAILLLLIALLYGIWKLLEDFRSPMLWALLVSLALRDVKVGLYTFNPVQFTHSLHAPGFNQWAHQVKTWFQSLPVKCNLYRSIEVALVRFWTKKLERHTLLGLGGAVQAEFSRSIASKRLVSSLEPEM
jgi:hypothetical protein